MIIIEKTCRVAVYISEIVAQVLIKLVENLMWLITARDCEHCKKGKYVFLCGYTCNDISVAKECKNSIYRKHFERERWLIR